MPGPALPVELIVRILEAVDPQALVKCRRTSRLVKSLIDETVALQYRIALYLSGLVDGPPDNLSISERLSLLRSYETSWRNLDWNSHTSLPVPNGRVWELYGNVWAHSSGDHAILFVQIPSRLRGIPMRQWTVNLDSGLRDFGMDPSQDLLVIIEAVTNASHFCRIRLLTLSTGEKHPLAQDPATLECTRAVPANPHIHWSCSIRVSEDYLGILFINHDVDDVDDNGENELVVWNWKTGVMHLRVTLINMRSFIFLGDRLVLASASMLYLDHERPSLLLYNFDQRLARGTHLLRFLLSTPRPGQHHFTVSLTSDPSPRWSSSPRLRVPFQIPYDERTIAFNLDHLYRGGFSSETFLIPAGSLLKHVSNVPVGEGRDIEWESWGPPCVERVRRQNWAGWDVYSCFVFGMRHILPKATPRDDRRVAIVRDLCPSRCMRVSEEEREESNALHQAMGCEEPYPRSIVKCVPLPTSIKDSSDVHLMISEDAIIALEDDLNTGNSQIHLLTF